MNRLIRNLVKSIEEKFKPVSIFLYGSRARTDFTENSDYEIGVLYQRQRKMSRLDLKAINQNKNINLYPFEYEDFLNHKIDTPFPEKIYLRELIESGRTISGKRVIETIKPPPIKITDLLEEISFELAML